MTIVLYLSYDAILLFFHTDSRDSQVDVVLVLLATSSDFNLLSFFPLLNLTNSRFVKKNNNKDEKNKVHFVLKAQIMYKWIVDWKLIVGKNLGWLGQQ